MQEEESIKYTDEQKVKFLHDTIAAQRKILAEQRALAKRNKPPSIPQLRNQMMTYLKHDERIIKYLNKKATGIKKDDSIEEESKEEEGTKKRKLGTRKKMKSRKRRFRQDTFEGLEGDEERLCDELHKLETSFGMLFLSCDVAAKKRDKGVMWTIFVPRMKWIFRRGAFNQIRRAWCLSLSVHFRKEWDVWEVGRYRNANL
ncbi:hypothetical protein Tco_1116410, partial [Tanacetum coccineum]